VSADGDRSVLRPLDLFDFFRKRPAFVPTLVFDPLPAWCNESEIGK
jgi:hypothetical protein